QNAAFMAAAIGRLTGRPGVCLVTSGPGTGNLVTGVATATTEGDPMVAIGGVVPLPDTLRQTHQSMDSVAVMKPVTKFSVAIEAPDAAGVPPSLPRLPLGAAPADMIRKDAETISKAASSADCSRTLVFAYGIRYVRLDVTS